MSDFFSKIIFIFSKAPSSPPRHNNGSSSNSNGTKLEPENVAKDGASEKPDLEESDGNMEISSESESETPKKSRKKKRKKEKNSKSSKVRYFVTKTSPKTRVANSAKNNYWFSGTFNALQKPSVVASNH